MEDLIPFLIFIVIALVNAVKFFREKGTRPPAQTDGGPPKRQPGTLEEFFEEIAEKFEPKPTELPGWPEGYERPDYRKEMESFETAQTETLEKPAAIPVPPALWEKPQTKVPPPKATPQKAATPGMESLRIPSIPQMGTAAGKIDFDLKTRKKLKQAVIANIIFSPPRAYDSAFNNTIAK